jgi:hypothetical protein
MSAPSPLQTIIFFSDTFPPICKDRAVICLVERLVISQMVLRRGVHAAISQP